jgi:iron-sulfur cluster assembly protein
MPFATERRADIVLTITPQAAETIEELTPADPSEGGLRISVSPLSSDSRGPEFLIELADAPEEGDQVLREHGAQVFLGPVAAQALDDKLLDVWPGPSGETRFAIIEPE